MRFKLARHLSSEYIRSPIPWIKIQLTKYVIFSCHWKISYHTNCDKEYIQEKWYANDLIGFKNGIKCFARKKTEKGLNWKWEAHFCVCITFLQKKFVIRIWARFADGNGYQLVLQHELIQIAIAFNAMIRLAFIRKLNQATQREELTKTYKQLFHILFKK